VTVGERLREARERQKVSLHAIAEKTNISVRFLDAIEKNQFDKLPGGIFTRGFIRSYASLVGLDPDGLVAQFLSDEPGQRDDDIDVAPASDRDRAGLGALLLAGLGAIVLALALVYFFRPDWIGLQATVSSPQQVAVPDAPSGPVVSESTQTPAGTEAPTEAGTSAASAATDAATGAGATPVMPAPTVPEPVPESPKSPLRLVIAPMGRCWVQVSADGQMRVAREIAAGERLSVDAAERLQITVGDAGNFAYELNERPGRALGAAGRVARATILPSTVPQFQVQ
jgi:cytoskeleton protein RodZ